MIIKKTEQILYGINKVKHLQQLRSIRPAIDNSLPVSFQSSPKRHTDIPYMRKHQIQVENRLMVSRILSIAKSQHPQVENQGYSKFNKPTKLFRNKNSIKDKLIFRQNINFEVRIKYARSSLKPIRQWSRKYSQSTSVKNNNRYLSFCQSKNRLAVPKQLNRRSQQHKINENDANQSALQNLDGKDIHLYLSQIAIERNIH